MSVHAISWVLRHSDSTLGARLVLLVLADHADGDGRNTYPSVETIAEEARMSKRHARRALRELERSGCIRATGLSAWKTVAYELVMNEGGQFVPMSEMSSKPSLRRGTSSNRVPTSLTANDLGDIFVEDISAGDISDPSAADQVWYDWMRELES